MMTGEVKVDTNFKISVYFGQWAVSLVVERYFDTVEVDGSIPSLPTINRP